MKISPQLELDLGTISLSENDIIKFAKRYDPLPFHTNRKIAEESIFKGLIASGPHIFNAFYVQKWLPLFGETVVAGMEVNDWKFLKPIYANQKINCRIKVVQWIEKKEKGMTIVQWYYEFTNPKLEVCQSIYVSILHKI